MINNKYMLGAAVTRNQMIGRKTQNTLNTLFFYHKTLKTLLPGRLSFRKVG